MEIDEPSPIRVASTPPAWGSTVYLPRPMNSRRTFSVSIVSTLNTDVLFANVGTPIDLMYEGRKEPRPASEYPQPAKASVARTANDAPKSSPPRRTLRTRKSNVVERFIIEQRR